MNETKKTDYLKFVLHKARIDLTRYNITSQDKDIIDKIFGKLIGSENLLRDFFILSHVNELKNIGKYFIFILKKIEDNVITFENLSQNIDADTEYLENELLNYLSNPQLREIRRFTFDEANQDDSSTYEILRSDEEVATEENISKKGTADTDEEEISAFKKNYLELIQSESEEHEVVYELPQMNKTADDEKVFELPVEEELAEDIRIQEEEPDNIKNESKEEEKITGNINIESTDAKGPEISLFEESPESENQVIVSDTNEAKVEETYNQKIQLSEEITEEINLFEKGEGNIEDFENELTEEEDIAPQPTNAAFVEYEKEITLQNNLLDKELDIMIYLVNAKPGDENERNSIIKNIIDVSVHLENISRKMSLEIISNIYQTMTLSFEKISDGKYDMAESTLNLFKKGLALVISLIKGDDYFGYKDILKSIENIRNALIEEKEKRILYLQQLKAKQEMENQLHQKYPDDTQKVKLGIIKQLVKDTEMKLNSLDKITGEYHIYEALRSLTGSLTNFKEIVILSKELEMKKMVQMAEASYIFLKFLQNYRINPVTIETKEIFGYIIYNLKSLVMGKETDDIDVFISYLNDPVKIYSKKTDKKKS